MEKIFYGGGGFLGIGGGDDIEVEVPEPVDNSELEEAERKRMKQRREQEANRARNRSGRQSSLLTGSGSTAGAPTKKASLLGHTAQS